MPGFRHFPLEDIQRIRQDLRDRYQDGFAILKELLQNADDAGATVPAGTASQLVLVLARNGLSGASHPLLQTAGLAVLNDGAFTVSDAISISSLGMSNKAGQAGAAGKFGLGLKSIFHWAEAFFYFSPHDFTGVGPNQAAPCDLLNPWWSRETRDGRHKDWEDAWSTSRARDLNAFTQLAQQALDGARWFGLWIPLRQQGHLRDGNGEIKPIEQRFPNADLDDLLGEAWKIRLAETLPLLRRLQIVRVCELIGQALAERARFEVMAGAQRIRFGLNGSANAASPRPEELAGAIRLGSDGTTALKFAGFEHLNGFALLQKIKEQRHWPNQTGIGSDGAERQDSEKAEPHGAVLFTRQPANGEGSLRVQHAVFLPLGEPEDTACDSQWRYSLYLHGFFFVDSGRRHIQPFNDLPADMTSEHADSESKVIKLWNRTLLHEVVAPLVLPSLDAFAKQEQMPADEVETLVGALRKSDILKPLLPWMCRGQRFVYRLLSNGGAWERDTWQAGGDPQRRWVVLPQPNFSEHELVKLLPALGSLCAQATVSFDAKPCLADGKPAQPTDSELAALLEGVQVTSFDKAAHLAYLLDLIPEDFAEREPDSDLVKALVRIVNQLLALPLPEDKELARKWKEFFNRLPAAALVRLPVKSSEADPAIKQALGSHNLPVALLWEDWREAKGDGKIPWADLVPVLQGLGGVDLRDERAIQRRSEVAVRLLEACGNQPTPWPNHISRLPLFACRGAGAQTTAASRADLEQADDGRRLFTSGDSWAKELAKAAPDLKPLLAESNVAKVLGLSEAPCDATACVRLLESADRLAGDFVNRKSLFDRLLGQPNLADSDGRQALRCLLHGQLAEWNSGTALFCEPPQTDAFVKLAKLALQSANQPWRFIPHPIAGQLRLDDQERQKLNLLDVSSSTVEALVQEIRPSNVDCTSLTTEECNTLLLQFNDAEVLRGLNIHETLDGRRVRIGAHTYVDDGSFKELPEAFNRLVTRIRRRTGYERDCFRNQDGSNRLVNKLSWEAVIEIALDQRQPADLWETILTAIGRLGTLRTELRDRVRAVAWLPLAAGGAAKPADLLHISGAETELDRLPPEVLNGKVPILRLAEAVRKHERFDTFTRTVLPQARESLDLLGSLLKPHPDWSTGLTGDWSAEQVADWVAALGEAPNEALPVAKLVNALHSREEHRELLPALLQAIGGQLSEAAYADLLKYLVEKHQQNQTEGRDKVLHLLARYLAEISNLGPVFTLSVLRQPDMKLVSKSGIAKAPDCLAFTNSGLDPEDQLHEDLSRPLRRVATEPVILDNPDELAANTKARRDNSGLLLRRYFAPWRRHLTPTDPIGALLVLLGTSGHEISHEFFTMWSPAKVFSLLNQTDAAGPELGDLQTRLAHRQFEFTVVSEAHVRVRSILGNQFKARLARHPTHLLIPVEGDPVTVVQEGDRFVCRLWLRKLELDRSDYSTEELIGLLRETASLVLANALRAKINVGPVFEKLAMVSQLQVMVAQNMIVDQALAFMRQVGAHTHPDLKKALATWDNARREEALAESNRLSASRAMELRRDARNHIQILLAEQVDAQKKILEAVKRRLEQFQYAPCSVPFELWQNADDAVVELERLQLKSDSAVILGFVVLVADDLVFAHWGRLINEFVGPDGANCRDLGFDRDLEKMLVPAISDKTEVSGQAAGALTGKFGLGFKSVFLVSDAPEVVSGSLDFVIRGGIYPVRLDTAQRDSLIEKLKQLAPEHWRRGTIIRLPQRADGKAKPDEVLAMFQRLAPLLVVFSRKLKRLRLLCAGAPEREVRWHPERLTDGIEAGAMEGLDAPGLRALVFSGAAGNDRMQLLLGLGPDGFVPLPKDVPTFWVTAPTRATPDYGFAVNGPFEPDVGRVQLALNSKRNVELADELARVLAERLKAVWQLAEQDWETVKAKLGLASGATLHALAESLWEVLGRRFAGKCPKSDTSQPAALARRILWQVENVGLRRFYADCAALPTGLWGEHQVLTKLGDLRFVAAGALDREQVFGAASLWPAFQREVRPGQVVSESHVASVLRRLDALASEPTELHLATVVEWELKQGQGLRADPEAAARLGQVVTPDFLKELKNGKPDDREEHEHKALSELLPKVLFQAADGSWHQPAELVVADGAGVDDDERMRAAFAPAEARLHPAYTGPTLAFFLACRRRLEADIETLFAWILQAKDDASKAAAMNYLLHGDEGMRHRLATSAREAIQAGNGGWLETVEEQSWFQQTCGDEEQDELAVHLLRTRKTEQPPPAPPARRREDWSAEDLLSWWQREQGKRREYTLEGQNWQLLRPVSHESDEDNRIRVLGEVLGNPDSDEGRRIWYRLFGLACLMAEGRRTSELRQFWTGELEGDGKFWLVTSQPSFREGADKVFERVCERRFPHVLANYERAYYWRRLFYDVRKMHRLVWESGFPAMILERARTVSSGRELIEFIRSGHLPGQAPWVGVVGQSLGSPLFFIIRELRRLGVIENRAVDSVAFFPCRPVRRAAASIGWLEQRDVDVSAMKDLLRVSEALHEKAQRVPVLSRDFDIPLLHMGVTCQPLPPGKPN